MDAGFIAQGLFKISIGVFCIVISLVGKKTQSKDVKFIQKYNKQILIALGILTLYRGALVFVEERKPELVQESCSAGINFLYNLDQDYSLDNTNNSFSLITEEEINNSQPVN